MRRNWKKVLSLVLALSMVLGMNTSAFATGQITAPENTGAEAASENAGTEAPVEGSVEEPEPAAGEDISEPEQEPEQAGEPEQETAGEPELVEEPEQEQEPAEEPAGDSGSYVSKFDWTHAGTEVDGLTVSFVSVPGYSWASPTTVSVAKNGDDIGISINGTREGYVLINGDKTIPGKICISTNTAVSWDSLLGVIISGNGIQYNEKDSYDNPVLYDDFGGEGGPRELAHDAKGNMICPGTGSIYVGKESGHIYKIGGDISGNTYTAGDTLYKDKPVNMTVSCDAWQVSFDEEIKAFYSTDSLYRAETIINSSVAAGEKADISCLYGKDAGTVKGLFVELSSGGYASVDKTFLDNKVSPVATVSGFSYIEDEKVQFSISKGEAGGTDEYRIEKKEDWETASWNILRSSAGWRVYEGGKPSSTDKAPATDYVIITRTRKEDKMMGFNVTPFRTKNEHITYASYGYTDEWKAYEYGFPEREFSVSQLTAGILLINDVVSDNSKPYRIVLEVSNNGTEVSRVYISNNGANTNMSVYVKAGENGEPVTIKDTGMYVISSGSAEPKDVPYGGLFPYEDQVVVSDNGIKNEPGTGQSSKLNKNDKVYRPFELVRDRDYSLNLDKVTLKLRENKLGSSATVVLVSGNKPGKDGAVTFTKDKETDIDALVDYVSTPNVVVKNGEKFGLIKSLPGKVEEKTVSDINIYSSCFLSVNEAGVYAFDTVSKSVTERKAMTFEEIDDAHKEIYSYGSVKELAPGQTYWIYRKNPSSDGKFANYGGENHVTLGYQAHFTVVPVYEKESVPVGSDFEIGKVSLKIGGTIISANKPGLKATEEDFRKAFNYDTFIKTGAAVSLNKEGSTEISVSSGLAQASVGDATYRLKIHDDVKLCPVDQGRNNVDWFKHNDAKLEFGESEIYVISDNATMTVEPGVFYYGQSDLALRYNAKATVKGKAVSWDDLGVEVGKLSGGRIADPYNNSKLGTLSVNDTFDANFYIKDSDNYLKTKVSVNSTGIKVNARPVRFLAKQNYFSVRYDDLVKAEATNYECVEVEDKGNIDALRGTVVDDPEWMSALEYVTRPSRYYVKDVTAVFGDNIKKDQLETRPYSYGLTWNLQNEPFKASANYIFTGSNADGFGYYVLPKYNVTYIGKFKTVSDSNTGKELAVLPDGKVSVNSVAAANITTVRDEFKYAEARGEGFDLTAKINLPAKEKITLNNLCTFRYWADAKTGAQLRNPLTLNTDSIYRAVIDERTPGFDPTRTASDNILSIEISDSVFYTGKKHVTDPTKMVSEYASVPGARNTVDDLLAKARGDDNSPDVMLNVYIGGKLLLEGYDYKAVYYNNKKVYDIVERKDDSNFCSKAPRVLITFKNQYADRYPTTTKYFSIKKTDIGDTDLVYGPVTEKRFYKDKTNIKSLKTKLVNAMSGIQLIANKNGKKDAVITVDGKDNGQLSPGEYDVKVTGTGFYTGEITTKIRIVDKKDIKDIKLKTGSASNHQLDAFTGDDTFETAVNKWLLDEVKAALKKDKNGKNIGDEKIDAIRLDDIEVTEVKGQDYTMPGDKKINFYLNLDNGAEKPVFYVVYGTFLYKIPKAKTEKIVFEYDKVPEGGVPYVKTGATLGYRILYDGQEKASLANLVKVKYSANKKPGGTAKAAANPIKGSYVAGKFNDSSKQHYIQFKVGKEILTEESVTLKYIVSEDAARGTDSKVQTSVKNRKSFVVKDAMGNVLKMGSDYEITVKANGADYDVTVKGKGNNYCAGDKDNKGFTVKAKGLNKFLGQYSPKLKTGFKLTKADIDAIENGKDVDEILSGNLIVTKGKDDISSGLGTDFHAVIAPNGGGGNAYIQIIGDEKKATYGASDVFGKKQVKIKVKK
ncbi:MAG: hypothetical protein J5829_09805 [Lachnospiraceae bacterium]|nr:hypothetical protein [Lachnospiraceae bacterium]